MKRIYADLHLCPNLNNSEQVLRLISKTSKFGYHLIAMVFPPNFAEGEIRRLQNVSKEAGIDLVSRVDLESRTSEELIHDLRRLRRRFEIIAVACESKSVARQAAKDRRVDLLTFPILDFRMRFFDKAEAELASQSLVSLEIDTKPLLTLEGAARIRHLSILRREARIAGDFHVPIVISSGISDEFLMRKPREQAALASLFDLDEASAVKAISESPLAIVKRNREKLSSRFVAPGIRMIRRGRNCE